MINVAVIYLHKSGPYENFLFFRWRYPEIMDTVLNCFIQDRVNCRAQKWPYHKPLFSDGNWKFGRCQSGDIIQVAKLANFKIRPTPGSKVKRIGILGPTKGTVLKIHYATPITRNLFGAFVAVGEPIVS